MKYIYILSYVALNIYALLALKWQTNVQGEITGTSRQRALYFVRLFMSPRVISIFAVSIVGFGFWMLALKEFPLAYAYMFTSLSYVAIPLLSSVLFKEPLHHNKIIGSLLIVIGICCVSLAGQ